MENNRVKTETNCILCQGHFSSFVAIRMR